MKEDEFKKKLLGGLEPQPEGQRTSLAQGIARKVQKQQSQKDVLNFGLVKFWTVLLQIFSVFYVQTKRRQHIRVGSRD